MAPAIISTVEILESENVERRRAGSNIPLGSTRLGAHKIAVIVQYCLRYVKKLQDHCRICPHTHGRPKRSCIYSCRPLESSLETCSYSRNVCTIYNPPHVP
jgi:hypothetical protein